MLQKIIIIFLVLFLQKQQSQADGYRTITINKAGTVYLHNSTTAKLECFDGDTPASITKSMTTSNALVIDESAGADVHVYTPLNEVQIINNLSNAYISADSKMQNDNLIINNKKNGTVLLDLACNNATITNEQAGDITLNGTVENLVINNLNAGNVIASKLNSNNIMCNIQGEGNININSSGKVMVRKTGSGQVLDTGHATSKIERMDSSLVDVNAEPNKDTIKLKLGGKDFLILDKKNSNKKDAKKSSKKTGPNIDWGGIEVGVLDWRNNKLEPLDSVFHKNSNVLKSNTVNVNIFEKKFGNRAARIVTGLGFNFNYYRFNRNWSPSGDATFEMLGDTNKVNKKIKLVTSSLAVPVMLQLNTSKTNNKALRLSFGVIGYYRFATALKTKIPGDKSEKKIERNNFGLNRFRADATLRIGYKGFYAFANYGITNLFTNQALGKQVNSISAYPTVATIAKMDVRPLTVGISIIGW